MIFVWIITKFVNNRLMNHALIIQTIKQTLDLLRMNEQLCYVSSAVHDAEKGDQPRLASCEAELVIRGLRPPGALNYVSSLSLTQQKQVLYMVPYTLHRSVYPF